MENTNCYIFAFATFGHPYDFRQTPIKQGDPHIAEQVKVFDLSNAIKVFPNSTIYSIRKEIIRNSKLISYSIYSFAQEQTSKRDGTFIGSSIIQENAISDELFVLSCLNEFHKKLTENNLNNGILKVKHSKDFVVPISHLSDFDKIENPQNEITDLNFKINNKSLVVYCDTSTNNLAKLLNQSIHLLNIYDTIYFTKSEEVAKFVMQKGIFRVLQNVGDKLEFEQAINQYFNEKNQKIELAISELEFEYKRINDEKLRTIRNCENQIKQNESIHTENERKIGKSKEVLIKIESLFSKFSNETKNLVNQLRNNSAKLNDLKGIHNNNKFLFDNEKSDLLKQFYNTTLIEKPKGISHTEHRPKDSGSQNGIIKNEELEEGYLTFNRYKIISFILTILLTISWISFFTFKPNSISQLFRLKNSEQVKTIKAKQEKKAQRITHLINLNPECNSELNTNDVRIVMKNLKPNMSLEDVVQVIFSKNPTEIGSVYSDQKEIYSKNILEINKQCFEEKDGKFFFVKDTLLKIPSYKK